MVPCGEDKGGGWLVDASSSSSGGNGSYLSGVNISLVK
jgi:hypothetical protein